MTMAIRLLATDLDGTLLRPDGSVSERTRRALALAVAAGLSVVVVTGRPPRSAGRVARGVGAADLAICCNGALIYDVAANAILQHTPLPAMTAQRLIVALRAALPGVCFLLEMGLQFACEPAYLSRRPVVGELAPIEVADALRLCRQPVTKLIAYHPELEVETTLPIVQQVVGTAAAVTHSGAPFVEISAAGVHKALALAWLCQQQQIEPAAVLAFGDMPNDLAMLEWAGHSVAVANAHPSVLAAVTTHTLANTEDGVAVVVERLARQQWRVL